MVSKILAGVFAAGVLTTGAYVYCTGSPCCSSRTESECPAVSSESSPCCMQPSRTSCCEVPTEGCCADACPSVNLPSEVLAIQPREVK